MTHLVSPKTMIFHHPGPVSSDAKSGSQVRPFFIKQAFEELGYEVESVVGYGTERHQNIKRILNDTLRGRHFSFIYSEARSIPTLLTEPNRLPRFPLLDFRFLRAMRKIGTPIGLFYRDIYWRFEMYHGIVPWWGRSITIPLYWYDWWWYQRVIDHIFLPSLAMKEHLPTIWPNNRMSALPPGAQPILSFKQEYSGSHVANQPLRLLYVGGIQPPIYDISPLLQIVQKTPETILTLCCRQDDWNRLKSFYTPLISKQIKIVHESGSTLTNLYTLSDIFVLFRQPHEYLDFAVPVKIFEALGHGIPILTLIGTEAARIIQNEGMGWVVKDMEEAQLLLGTLHSRPEMIDTVRNKMREILELHTWKARAREVAFRLDKIEYS